MTRLSNLHQPPLVMMVLVVVARMKTMVVVVLVVLRHYWQLLKFVRVLVVPIRSEHALVAA